MDSGSNKHAIILDTNTNSQHPSQDLTRSSSPCSDLTHVSLITFHARVYIGTLHTFTHCQTIAQPCYSIIAKHYKLLLLHWFDPLPAHTFTSLDLFGLLLFTDRLNLACPWHLVQITSVFCCLQFAWPLTGFDLDLWLRFVELPGQQSNRTNTLVSEVLFLCVCMCVFVYPKMQIHKKIPQSQNVLK